MNNKNGIPHKNNEKNGFSHNNEKNGFSQKYDEYDDIYKNGMSINFDDYDGNYQNLLIKILLQFRMDIKMYHWQTKYFSKHKISDELLSSIDDISDKIIEVMLGKFNMRPDLNDSILIRNIDDNIIIDILYKNVNLLEKILNYIKFVSFKSLIDELLVEINKILYLMSFN